MKCPTNRLSNLLLVTLIICITQNIAHAGIRDDLYETGIEAYDSKNYVIALKNLYAFYVLNESAIDQNPDFKRNLLSRIETSETILKVSYAASPTELPASGGIRIRTNQIDRSMTGTASEIESLLKNQTMFLESINNQHHSIQ